jgi:hypothetical protein
MVSGAIKSQLKISLCGQRPLNVSLRKQEGKDLD